jgi:hypothetical protein
MKTRAVALEEKPDLHRGLPVRKSGSARPGDGKWNARFEELREFQKAHGHCNVPRDWPANPGLSFWVINQRRQLRLGKLSNEHLRQLEGLDIRWRTAEGRTRDRENHWNRLCDALHAFLRKHGHCDVPEGWTEDPELARWVVRQRHLKRSGALREDRLRRFEERGIDWSLEPRRSRARDRGWDRMYYALKEFHHACGHCRVPKNWRDHPRLARWTSRQRFLLRHSALRPDRRARLEELDFHQSMARSRVETPRRPRKRVSTIRENAWSSQYEALRRFHELHGHSDVPRRLEEDPALARWVSHQRELKSSGRLPAGRIALLDQLQFPWSGRGRLTLSRDSAWERAFARLAAYRKAHGTCNVPARHAQDPFLGHWVSAQRRHHKTGRLKPERVRRLARLGLKWQGR